VILTVIGTVFIIVAINGKKGRGQIAIQKAFHLNFPPFCGQIVTRSINFKQAETSNFAHDNVIGTGGSTNLSAVCLSVRPIIRPHAAAAGLLLWARRAGRKHPTALQQQMQAVQCCQLTQEAGHRPTLICSGYAYILFLFIWFVCHCGE